MSQSELTPTRTPGRRKLNRSGKTKRRHTLAATSLFGGSGPSSPAPSSSPSPSEPRADEDVENIRVVCRLRPDSDFELSKGGVHCVNVGADGQTVTYTPETGEAKTFTFNRAFDEYVPQEEVYDYAARPMVEGALNGFSSAIIAYGQTGAGKTYTMQGPGMDDPKLHELGYDQGMKGIIPRVMEEIFQQVAQAPQHIQIDVSASYLEIYMEKVKDLLAPNRRLEILDEPGGGVVVTGAEVLTVLSSNEIIAAMQRGALNRVVASTKSNDESSRGHAIFLITLTKRDSISQVTQNAQLYLVDLAGSEKADKTEAAGLRLDEAKKINQSLLALGNVISALSGGEKRHVPYRNSKLTRLLKNSLGGNARTTLIVNCSPNSFNVLETLSTLRFGYRASKIKNKPMVNQYRSVEVLEALLQTSTKKNEEQARYIGYLQAELERLRELLPADLRDGQQQDAMRKGKEKLDDLDYSDDKENRNPLSTQPIASVPPSPSSSNGLHRGHPRYLETTSKEEQDDLQQQANVQSMEGGPNNNNNITATATTTTTMTTSVVNGSTLRRDMLHFLCPLTRGIFSDPVFCSDGHTYERRAIRQYLKAHHKSPLTGQRLENKKLTPNYHLRKLLAAKRDYDPAFCSINFFAEMPYELVFAVFSRLDPVSLARAMMVCRLFLQLLRDERFWRQLMQERDPPGVKSASESSEHGKPRERYFGQFRAEHLRKRADRKHHHPDTLTLFRT